MEIIVGKLGGFCAGVNNTITTANKLIEKEKNIYSLGEIVHNERVINNLENKGLITINNINDIPNNSKVIFRAHGEAISSYEIANNKNLTIIDLTCPKVKLIHDKIKKHNNNYIVVIGKKTHPETIGHISYANSGIVIENIEEIDNIKTDKDIYIVVQTTFKEKQFKNIANSIKEKYPNTIIDNTICNTTHDRQEEVAKIAKKVDMMIIVGGKNSSNTKELANISSNYCNKVLLIQDINDLKEENLNNINKIGIMGGASTPQELIDEVYNYLLKF